MSARQILRDAGPTWLAGMAISTPLIALLQGALLLQDYRSNHSHAPRPDMPARGVVVVGPSNNNNATTTTTTTTTNMDSSLHYMATSTTNTTTTYSTTTASVGSILYPRIVKPPAREEPPLRLLVIGDSLAAGVGMSRSGTPALPEAIARGLSQAAGGRAVYWTCVGTPGRTATEIVREIRHLDDVVDKNNTESNKNNTDSNNTTLTDQATGTMLPEKLRAWQAESRWKASERLRLTKLRTQRWLQHRKQSAVVQEEEAAVVAAENAAAAKRIAQWWTRKVAEIRRDVQEFKQIASLKDDDEYNEINEDDSDDIDKPRARQEYTPPPRTLDPELVGEYDIAIVLTGLNDLKDSFLPFMMSAQRLKKLEEARQESGSLGLKDELMRVVHALKSRMNLLIPPVGDKGAATPSSALKSSIEHVDASSSDTTIETLEESKEKHGSAVVVFPALPFSPSSFSQLAPLSWFLTPLVRMMDSNKRNLADMYPDTVVYVETPSRKWILLLPL